MGINKGMFSTGQIEWETPAALFDKLDSEFGFTLDVCATQGNAKCARYYSTEQDGLRQAWSGVCWMNPPYGRVISRWVKKAYESALSGATVVCLLPARTDTKWWHEYCMKGEIRFIERRVKFVGGKSSAPFPSVVVIFQPLGEHANIGRCFTWHYRSK